MGVKIFFVGNRLASDDGIGPHLYEQLKDHKELSGYELMEAGVIGLDLISYVEEGDKLIIVDAVKTKKGKVGDVIVLGENDLSKDLKVVSQHDFGVEQTALMLRAYMPGLEEIKIVGIKVDNLQPFSIKLSEVLMKNIEDIKTQVVKDIVKIANSE